MESVRNAHSIQQLSELAGCLPAVSSTTAIKAYYESSDKLLLNAEAAHKVNHIDEEYMWLMRFVILIYERMPNHEQYNKTAEAQKLNRVYRGKSQHVLNRLEFLKGELVIFYETKARLIAAQAEERAHTTNPRAKPTTSEIPTESQLMARLSRLNQSSAPKATATIEAKPTVVEKPNQSAIETPQVLDFSIFETSPKADPSRSSSSKDPLDEIKLIPDVEIKDDRLDLSWLEDDPMFGSKNRKNLPEPVPKLPSPTPYPSILAMSSESDDKDKLPDWIAQTLKKPAPPPYKAVKIPEKGKEAVVMAPEPSKPATKYSVTTVTSEPEPVSRSPFSLPAYSEASSSSFSITQTIRGQQFDAEAMNRRLLDTTVGATCSDFIAAPLEPAIGLSGASPAPSAPLSSPQYVHHVQSPATKNVDSGGSSLSSSSKPPINASSVVQKAQFVPVIAGGAHAAAAHYLYQPSPNSQSRLPVMGNVPVVFRPNQLNMFDPSKVVMAVPGALPSALPSAFPGAFPVALPGSAVSSSGSSSPSPSPAPSPSPDSIQESERPPTYKKSNENRGSSASPSSKGSSSAKPAAPSYAAAIAKTSNSHSAARGAKSASTAVSSPRASAASSSPSTFAASAPSSAFPLMTNQRPGTAIVDNKLRKIEMDGDMFDKFMSNAHRNTARSIETCGILAGKYLAHKKLFRVTHLIIPKQTGTTDTCATTNEDEIFEYQIKHDLLTLGWIHTHPTQACFLSSVDLHTHCSYQSLFPEAVAVVIAPRDTPNFSFFHLSDSGFQIVQNCPLTGFHHHPERGLYQACSHVVLTWNSKKPCKVVDMR
jgi:STAM-binding protein